MLSVVNPDVGGPGEQPTGVAVEYPSAPTAACRCETESWPGPGGEILVVRVSGELDLLTCPILTAALLDAVSRAPRHLVVDLSATTFCCVRGYELLARTAAVAAGRGIGFALSGLTVHQHRVAGLTLPDPGPVRHRSVAAAVTTIRAEHDRLGGPS